MTALDPATAERSRRGRGNAPDPILLRLPAALWHALPAVLVSSLIGALAAVLAVGAVGVDGTLGLGAGILVASAAQAVAVQGVSRRLFDDPGLRGRRIRRILRALAVSAPAALLAVGALVWARAAVDGAGALASLAMVVAALLAAVAGLVALVAVPLAVVRTEARILSVLKVAGYATARFPLPALGAAAGSAAFMLLCASTLPGLLSLAPAVVTALSVAAAWPTLARAGVAVPAFAAPSPRTPGKASR